MRQAVSSTDGGAGGPETAFHHEALLYDSDQSFLDGTVPFVRAGLEAGEPVLAVLGAERRGALRDALGVDAGAVGFAAMEEVGTNPARIIPEWRAFVDASGGRRVRGIGEPVWPGRSAAELAECRRHESLLNLAFAETDGFRLLCPYDTAGLDPAVVEAAASTHPYLHEAGVRHESHAWAGLDQIPGRFDEPLPAPPYTPRELTFRRGTVRDVRTFVAARAAGAGLSNRRLGDLLLAVTEIATNSVRHAGGWGMLRVWRDDEALVCEVRDSGCIEEPLAGRERPAEAQVGGYGLWLANQLCDLVQVRSFAAGNVVRLHMRTR